MSPASGFDEREYAASLKNTLRMDALIGLHSAIMDKYDPKKKVGLMVDEWGFWGTPDNGTNFMFMRQQGSLRDAIVAALNLNIFARHADRVRMANIAQIANVIHALILTRRDRMLLTPTYHIYKMYVPFQNARLLPLPLTSGQYQVSSTTLPQSDAIAARATDGSVWLALTNPDANREVEIAATLEGLSARSATGEVLTAPKVDAVHSFEAPHAVSPTRAHFEAVDGRLNLRLPPRSVTDVRLEP